MPLHPLMAIGAAAGVLTVGTLLGRWLDQLEDWYYARKRSRQR